MQTMINRLLVAFDEQIEAEKGQRDVAGSEDVMYSQGRIDGVDTGRALIEEVLGGMDVKERVLLEIEQLSALFTGLDTFIETSGFNKLSVKQQALLKRQFFAMRDYLNVLNLRIKHWED